jgi:hypothetical protein
VRIEQYSLRVQRITALALLGLALAAGIGLLAGPYLVVAGSYEHRLGQLTEKLQRYRVIVQQGDGAGEQQRVLTRLERSHGYYLSGDKPTLAAAELQRRVKQVIEQQGGTVVSSQVLGEKDEGGLRQLALRVTMRTGIETFARVLHTLEAQPPVLVLENVHIGARPGGATARWRGSANLQEIDVRFDVLGFRRGAEQS